MIRLPINYVAGLIQKNLGDKFNPSDLWGSFNLDLSKKLGTLLVSPRMLLNINTDDDAQLDAPPVAFRAFITSTPDIWAIAGAFMWSTSTGGPNDTFAQDATGSTPTNLSSDQSDMDVFGASLVVTGSNDIYLLSSSKTWSALSNSLASSSGIHALTVFRAQNKTYIIDDNAAGVTSLNVNLSTVVLSTSGSQYSLNDLVEGAGGNVGSELSCIASKSDLIGIGTINKSGSTCKFYVWDGSQASGPNNYYKLYASGILAVIVVDDTFVVFDTKGRLLQLNGGTFTELARLPLGGATLKLPLSTPTSRPVHFNGMSLVDGNIEILINTQLWETNSPIKENVPSGIWCYDRRTKNFYHKRSIGLTKSGGTITDYGASKLSLVGALSEVEVISTDITQGSINGQVLAGCSYFTTATVTKSGIFYDDSNDTLQKAAVMVSGKMFSPNIKDNWRRFYCRLRKFLNSTDKIVLKARSKEDVAVEATITYTSTTQFTVPTASFSTAPSVGDEVEILQGIGAGRCAHITVISTNGANYEVTVDETITGATTQTAKARFQTWRKIGTFSSQTDDVMDFPLTDSEISASVWIQFKLWILWTGKNEIHDFVIANTANQEIE